MSKIFNTFKNEKAFIGFLTAGDPSIEKSKEFIMEMVRGGADLIEIGIPFSDPVAEGKVIQEANIRALSVDTTTDKVFELVDSVRKDTDIPLVFLTYLNPVFNYGYDNFFTRCKELGVDGIIIPDLPYEEKGELDGIAKSYDVDLISLIAPTSENRIKQIVNEAAGFIYIVSSMGVTGVRSEIKTDINSIIKIVKENSKIPVAVGFGINTPNQAKELSQIADGVIVGSAIVKIIEKYEENAGSYIYEYVKSMKDAIKK
ncbi:tryptophan synthase subunit alpha [Anaerovorax odorimutans]|uniref:tryptophan synthase subunit alpha n=1 Tax=Anaerovorax odorimutans TaxID=109327 RepID=UPI0003FE11B6|nr:tryptophan synthase subunit alpha [Anaerovorax odorimutans]